MIIRIVAMFESGLRTKNDNGNRKIYNNQYVVQ